MSGPHPRRTTRTLLTLGTLALASTACELNLSTEGLSVSETKSFQVTGQPELVLDTFDGSIEIHSWDRDVVEVEVEKRAMEQNLIDEIKVSAEQTGNKIVLKVTGPQERTRGITIGTHISPSARLRVAVPRLTMLQATSGDGSISVEEISGTISLQTQDGSIRAVRLIGDIHVRSGDGSIRMEKIEGRLDLETTDGSIVLEAKPTMLHARTADGTIRLRIDSGAAMTDDWDVTTGDGSVTLTLPANFDAELDAESADGSVRASHPGIRTEERPGGDRQERRRSLKATMGQGGKVLRVRTSDGSVRIES